MLVNGFMSVNYVKSYSNQSMVIVVFSAHMAQLSAHLFKRVLIVVASLCNQNIKWITQTLRVCFTTDVGR